MAEVEIYSSPLCGFCHHAKSLLKAKGVAFTEINVLTNSGRKKEMIQRAGGRTSVPQIFIDNAHIGGCDDLYALDRSGRLDPLLQPDGRADNPL
jgi:glutaredoxin 3